MHLFIVEGQEVEQEFRHKFGPAHTYDFCTSLAPDLLTRLGAADIAFDLREWPELHYEKPRQPIFYDSTTHSLAQLFHGEEPPFGPVFGLCSLPSLIAREVLEVSCYCTSDALQLAAICEGLGTDFRIIQDRVALLTPRTICLLINEACHALQEGVTTLQDINLLLSSTNVFGPFTLANNIGVSRVYKTLEALYQDTYEARYKPCSLLKRMHLRGESFLLEPSC